MRRLYICLLGLLFFSFKMNAQSLPPGRPEQDACNALVLCGGSFSTSYSYNGYGSKLEQSQPAACFDETNSVWLRIQIATPGDIYFVITPVFSGNDYDFAVYNITGKTCDSVNNSTRVRCNGADINSSPGGQTGLLPFGTGTTSGPGPGIPFISPITAAAGDTYLIMIDNFYQGPQSGFTIDFTGSTATFVTNPPPHFDSISVSCSYADSIQVHLSRPVKCSSLQTNGSDYHLTPSGTISSVVGQSCTSGNGYTSDFTVHFGTPLAPGTYVLRPQNGSDGNTVLDICNVSQLLTDSIVFTVAAPLTVNAGPDLTTCVNNSIQLNGATTGGPWSTLTYQWSPATYLSNATIANPVASPVAAISYILTVTPNGLAACRKSDTVRIDVLTGFALTNNDTTLCFGNSVQLNAVGDNRYTYTWTPSSALSNPTAPNPIATPTTTTTYTITASYAGCRDSVDSVKVTIQPGASVYIGADRTLCYGDTIHFNPVIVPDTFTGYTYKWTPASVFSFANIRNPIFYATDTTTIALEVTTTAGCRGSDTAKINVIPNNFITLSSDTAICPRDSAQLTVSGGVSYVWTPAYTLSNDTIANPVAKPITTTTYTVYGTNILGCRDTQSVQVVVRPGALISLPDSVTIYPGESYAINPGGNGLYFTWFPQGGLSDPNIANPIATPAVNTRYKVTAISEAGCFVSDSIDINVSLESLIDMPNAFTPGSAPNAIFKPAHRGAVTLQYMRIFDRWGQKVFETSNVDNGWDGTFNGKTQPMGVYVYIVEAKLPSGRIFKKQGNVTLLR